MEELIYFLKIERDWIYGEHSLFGQDNSISDDRYKKLRRETGVHEQFESANPEKIPKLIKILFYFYIMSQFRNGIAKEYWSDPQVENDAKLMDKLVLV